MSIIYELSSRDVRQDVQYIFEKRKELSGDPAVNGGQQSLERSLKGHSPLLVKYTETHQVPVIPVSEEDQGEIVSVDLPTLEKMAATSHAHRPHLVLDGDQTMDESGKPKLIVKDTLAISLWSYKGCDGDCPICMQSLMKLCPTCESGKRRTECVISIGNCGHAIHEHCFSKFESKALCLMCRQPWIRDQALALN